MRENEIELIKEISTANNVDPQMLIKLIHIERNHANLNMSRRHGIYKELDLVLEQYIDQRG